jgi:hypothetical protein
VELARRFGDATSPGFVNAVLDAVRREAGIAAWPVGGEPPGPAGAE